MTTRAPIVILVNPQMGENIGAVARAMGNFGLSELRLVAPRDGWPNPKATSMAAGAEHVLAAAKAYPTFAEALEGIHLAFATTARPRDMEKRMTTPEDAAREAAEMAQAGKQCALVFGPERTGMENADISLCDTIVSIPTSPDYRSLNLAQSTVIMGYEWFKASGQEGAQTRVVPDIAPKEDWVGLFGQLEEYLDQSKYFRVEDKKTIMWQNLKNTLLRGKWSTQEIQTMRGVLRCLWERRRG
jgi:tRNA/rRNA methyltransferase